MFPYRYFFDGDDEFLFDDDEEEAMAVAIHHMQKAESSSKRRRPSGNRVRPDSSVSTPRVRNKRYARETEMASAGAEAAAAAAPAPVGPAEGSVIAINSLDEWSIQIEEATSKNKLVVIDFTASWCPPCRLMAPIFADMAKKNPNVVFLKVDVDEMKAIAEQFSVEAMPTFLFMKEGEV